MYLREFLSRAKEQLLTLYPAEEASAIVGILCEECFGVKSYTSIVEPEFVVKEKPSEHAEEVLRRLMTGEPLQYVLGFAEFCGERFVVNPSVLIPRPETEDLCRMAMEFAKTLYRGRSAYGEEAHPVRIADLCTGSGCIAWTLGRNIPESQVVGVDISRDAVALAASQFPKCKERPSFLCYDIFDGELSARMTAGGPFDIVVSNPPYILESERAQMHRNVLEHEPATALFVPDEDAMRFNRRIAGLCRDGLLSDGGWVFVEINERLAEQSRDVFGSFREVAIVKDFVGKSRFLKAKK